ncbi:MAG TPA: pilus assembly PilX N-terminal domain-containing protein [Gemmatimonadaceae bacterium]|nr:pilus assembly PilX N-terminal domain-containing protein [Gemmatimonadaceae bacterium]
MTRLKNRDGFALPMSILIIAVLTAAVAASFSSTTAEYLTNRAERGTNRAYHLAETGLEQFMVMRGTTGWCLHCGDPIAVDSEWTRVTLPGGYADVVAVKVRPAIDSTTPALFFIRSKGVDTSVQIGGAGNGTSAEHTVGVYAKWTTATMKVTAAWVSLSGLVKNGTGTIDGTDFCGQAPSVAGAQVDKGDLIVNGGASVFDGSPPVDTSQTFTQLKTNTPIDWDGIINQNSMPADITIPGQAFPSAATFAADTNYWPVIRIHTNGYSLPNQGRGIIIADSDFAISGSNMWAGIVLVGGTLTSNGNNTTYGATLSGLNFLLGGTPSPSKVDDSDANGQKTYVYDSCSVSKASSRLRKYITIPNSWSDNLASW